MKHISFPPHPHLSPLRTAAIRILTTAVTVAVMVAVTLTALPCLSGCTASTANPPAETTASNDALRAYYEALLSDLEQEILTLKEENYIARHEYEARIALLKEEIALLEANGNLGADIPVSGKPTDSETTAKPDEDHTDDPQPNTPAGDMAFRYGMEDGQAVIYAYEGTATAVTIPATIEGYPVTKIADNAFAGTAVTSVILPATVTHIGWFAFYGCPALEALSLTASVTRIDYAAFDNCPRLTLLCPADSYAARYAASFGLRHEYT